MRKVVRNVLVINGAAFLCAGLVLAQSQPCFAPVSRPCAPNVQPVRWCTDGALNRFCPDRILNAANFDDYDVASSGKGGLDDGPIAEARIAYYHCVGNPGSQSCQPFQILWVQCQGWVPWGENCPASAGS